MKAELRSDSHLLYTRHVDSTTWIRQNQFTSTLHTERDFVRFLLLKNTNILIVVIVVFAPATAEIRLVISGISKSNPRP